MSFWTIGYGPQDSYSIRREERRHRLTHWLNFVYVYVGKENGDLLYLMEHEGIKRTWQMEGGPVAIGNGVLC